MSQIRIVNDVGRLLDLSPKETKWLDVFVTIQREEGEKDVKNVGGIHVNASADLDFGDNPLSNVAEGLDAHDAATLGQVVTTVDDSFNHAIEPTAGQEMQLLDPAHSSGYGFQDTITYFGLQTGDNTNLNVAYSHAYFIHLKSNTTTGWVLLHQNLLNGFITEDIANFNELGIVFDGVFAALGQSGHHTLLCSIQSAHLKSQPYLNKS